MDHRAAYTRSGFEGSAARSIAPASAPRYRTFVHVFPPFVVRYTPRSGLGPYAWPMAATSATDGSRGSTRIFPMCRVASSPTCDQRAPPSVERYTPSPYVMSERMSASPVPTHSTSVSEGAIAIAPIEGETWPSEMDSQVRPALVVFHTPPSTAPNKKVRGLPGIPAAARTRPARKGPISRQRMPT